MLIGLFGAGCTSSPHIAEPIGADLSVSLDHTYRSIADATVYQNLIGRGFSVGEDAVNHPGRQTCQFFHFQKGENRSQYIEFCYTNPSLPKDMGDEAADSRDPWPGLALSTTGPLKPYYEAIRGQLGPFKPEFHHKNYDWAKDHTSALPGWNNINFKEGSDPVKGVYLWFNEYEKRPRDKEPTQEAVEKWKAQVRKWQQHANAAQSLLGVIWKLSDPGQRANFEKVSSAKAKGSRSELADGTWVEWIDSSSELNPRFADKTYTYLAVVLGVSSLKTFDEIAKPDDKFLLNGKPASRIRLAKDGWDIIAIEKP